MTDKLLEEKRKEFDDLMREWGVLPFSGSAHRAVELWDWIERLVEEVEIGAIENFIKILIENTEVIGDESVRLVYLKGITRKRLKELLKETNLLSISNENRQEL